MLRHRRNETRAAVAVAPADGATDSRFGLARGTLTRLIVGVVSIVAVVLGGALIGRAEDAPTPPSNLPVRSLARDELLLFHDERREVQPVRSVEDWQQRRKETLEAIRAVLGPLPGDEKRCPLDVKIEAEVDAGTYLERRISYASEPGGRVPAYLLIPKGALQPDAEKAPGVLCLHPTHHEGPRLITSRETNNNRQYGKELAERGYVVLAPSYPLLGDYQPDLKKLGWESGLLKAVWDNIRGLDLLDSLPFVKAKRYAAIGHSLGGHNSVFTTLFDDRLVGVVSSCGLDSFVDYYKGNPDVWLPERGWTQTRYVPKLAAYRGRLAEIPFDYHEIIASIAPRAVLIVAPLKDDNFRADSVDRIAAAARPVFELYKASDRLRVEHPDDGHNFPAPMREQAYELIDSLLRP